MPIGTPGRVWGDVWLSELLVCLALRGPHPLSRDSLQPRFQRPFFTTIGPKSVQNHPNLAPSSYVFLWLLRQFFITRFHAFLKFNALPVHLLRQVHFLMLFWLSFLKVSSSPLFGLIFSTSFWDHYGRLSDQFLERFGNMFGKSLWHRFFMLFRCI